MASRSGLSALERLDRLAGRQGCTVGIRAILHHGHGTATARLATLEVRADEHGPFRARELIASVRMLSMRMELPDLSVDEAATSLLEQLQRLSA